MRAMLVVISNVLVYVIAAVILVLCVLLCGCLYDFIISEIIPSFYRKDNHGESGEEGSTED